MHRLAPLILVFLVLAGCADRAPSGLEGIVFAGDRCGQQQAGAPRAPDPIDARIIARPFRGKEKVAFARTGQDGTFRMRLPPGVYDLVATATMSDQTGTVRATVRERSFTSVLICVEPSPAQR